MTTMSFFHFASGFKKIIQIKISNFLNKKVKITDKVGEWSEIKIEDGNSGWIKTSEMEII